MCLYFSSCSYNNNPTTIEQGNNRKLKYIYYKVRPGDTLYNIGLKYNLSVSTLKKINNIDYRNKIVVGKIIKISINSISTKKTQSQTRNNKNNKTQIKSNKVVTINQIKLSNIKFTWPLKGNILNSFNGKTNKGIDIVSKLGTAVKSAADGIVVHAGYVKGYGKSIIISHDSKNKILTVYGYLSNILIKKGAKVKINDKIALVGNDETSSARLHFEIRNNTIALNPLNYLPK